MKLYTYFRSSSAYRVRIALNLKQLAVDMIPVHIVKNGGEQFLPAYRELNPAALVPIMVDEDSGATLSQSLAIMEYLDEVYPQAPLLPSNPADRAYVRGIALSIACEIHPINNLRVLQYLTKTLAVSDDAKNTWYRHWCAQGLSALEATLAHEPRVGTFCYGETPTLADCCLVPQIFNAQRFQCDLSGYPTVMRIHQACLELAAFQQAAPASQLDAE